MSRLAPVKLAVILAWISGAVIVLMPFHAFLTVWLSSFSGHYTLIRLWKEVLLAIITAGSLYLLVKDRGLQKKIWSLGLVELVVAYLLLLLVCGIVTLVTNSASPKAVWYGLLVDSRFLIFFLDILIISSKTKWLRVNWQKATF